MKLPERRGWPEHEYIYSTQDGCSCSCGWRPPGFRVKDAAEWDAHLDAAGVPPVRVALNDRPERGGGEQ